jgi:uncharacterized membrane protein
MIDSDARTTLLFEMSEESIITTVQPAYSILAIIEGIGGFAVVIIFVAKFLVGGFAERIFKSELIEKFYQVNQATENPLRRNKNGV